MGDGGCAVHAATFRTAQKLIRIEILNGKRETFLVALACSDAPEGCETWTMQLLAERLMELSAVERISDETVRTALKKKRSSL